MGVFEEFDEASTNDRRSLDESSTLEGKVREGKGMEVHIPKNGNKSGFSKLSESAKRKTKHPEQPDDLQIRLAALFNRKPETLWCISEYEAYQQVNPTEDDVKTIEIFYANKDAELKSGKTNYWKSDLLTLLNQWGSQLDRALSHKPDKPNVTNDDDHARGF